MNYEPQQHFGDPAWRFDRRAFETVHDKFELLNDKHFDHHEEMIKLLRSRWADSFLSSEEAVEIAQLAEAERAERKQLAVRDPTGSLWFFFVSVCRDCNEDDYWMSSEETFSTGAVSVLITASDANS